MPQLIPYTMLKSLYSASPLCLQRAYSAIPFSFRAGRVFRNTSRLIKQTDFLSHARLEALQEQRLNQLLRYAYENVPFYRTVLRRCGFSMRCSDAFAALRRLPIVEKRDFQEQRDAFVATGGLGEAKYVDNTGGSTGTPFAFLKNNSMYPIEQAYMMSLWRRVGYHSRDRKLTLRGRAFVDKRSDARWQYNPIYNEVALSSYHLDAETISESLKAIHKFRPRFIHGYPSAIVTFLSIAVEHGLELPDGIRAVLCGSEPLYPYQRSFISRLLGCRVFSWYGQSECVLLAGECEFSHEYHVFPLYGIVELVNDCGEMITTPGVEGEIVGTSLNNTAMPFIRYRTDDRGILSEGTTCECGRSYPRLKTVTGRKQQFIYTRDLTPVPVTAFVFGQHFGAFQRIRGLQLVQDEPGVLVVRITRQPDYGEKDEQELKLKMEGCVDGSLRISIEYVERLPVNAAGKTEFVIQNIKTREVLECSANG